MPSSMRTTTAECLFFHHVHLWKEQAPWMGNACDKQCGGDCASQNVHVLNRSFPLPSDGRSVGYTTVGSSTRFFFTPTDTALA